MDLEFHNDINHHSRKRKCEKKKDTFSDKQRLKEFVFHRLSLEEPSNHELRQKVRDTKNSKKYR